MRYKIKTEQTQNLWSRRERVRKVKIKIGDGEMKCKYEIRLNKKSVETKVNNRKFK